MDNRFIKASTLKSIADAIRAKKGTNSPLAVADFAEEIKNLVVGGSSSVTVPCRIPHVYHTESVEALPNDAIDGSLAVVSTEFFGWGEKSWGGYDSIYGSLVYHSNGKVYFFDYGTWYTLEGDTWVEKTWEGIDFSSLSVTAYNGTLYAMPTSMSRYDGTYDIFNGYKLNGDVWEAITWKMPYQTFKNDNLWKHNGRLYYSYESQQWCMNENFVFEEISWNGTNSPSNGRNIYHINGTAYWSNGSVHFYLDDSTNTWIEKTGWGFVDGSSGVFGEYVWEHEGKTYYCGHKYGTFNIFYVFNEIADTWETVEWNLETIYGDCIWHNGDKTYYSYPDWDVNHQYELGIQIKNTLYSRQNGEWVSENEVDFGKCYEPHIIEVAELPTENIDEIALYKIGDAYYQYVEGEWKSIGAGGGSSECSGNHIIEVDELPTENIDEEAIYKLTQAFGDIVVFAGGSAMSLLAEISDAQLFSVTTKPTENIVESDFTDVFAFYYVETEDIFFYADISGNGAEWISVSLMLDGLPFQGAISDVSEATAEGYYAVGGKSYYQYVNGAWEKMVYEPTSEEQTVTPTKSTQTVIPSGADYLSKVTVNPIPSNYIVPSGTKQITINGTADVKSYSSVDVYVKPIPVEIATASEMANILTYSPTVGAIYKYTGETGIYETGTYENGALYVVGDISDLELQSIYLDPVPKTEYHVDDKFSYIGGMIVCVYNHGIVKKIPLKLTHMYGVSEVFDESNEHILLAGEYTITVKYTYDEKTCETQYTITVSE